ncbi:dihydrofolate reductase [Capnocytophaga catalasegens]|uniref:Dihydrofolate reductase n=1 Tax=Capnocytophaga catalasegens TaxID=1004260 RepID=A0AAV5AQ90_9FLAO|nr:dihydrofolate reductase [Capnocytophaga catalasegens]GIZ16238.1 dihydrofolate reductase [Capnocytophaga catalasegens]GJM49466.1 dihydrofolate reductase [Capnocytophaga catalasegens]GJM53628.1 dihydrofolate reductase [Capnocytophaga catalasegens]
MLTLIAAIGQNNSLGKNNQLLWHLPNDFKRFKTLTLGHNIIMGRKTFESLPKLLPNRKHIIISKQVDYTPAQCIVVSSVEEALAQAKKDDENPFVIGGGIIYSLMLPLAKRLEITQVHHNFDADTFFPEIDLNQWDLAYYEPHYKDDKHAFDYTFKTYIRKQK